MTPANLFADIPAIQPDELFQTLVETPGLTLERIVSDGQATPEGQWYDQERDEWVLLLSGEAGLLFADEDRPRVMRPGDHVLIPAHRRHRVAWTAAGQKTVWLALHFNK